jgi:hypothetical protein
MSLHQLATHAASAGRNGDSMLVHMSPKEVAGLQALALKHGTSMTINPHTGLPEAFSLKSLLPALAGLALGPAGFGLMSSLGAAATVGGISALSSGSLTKGLMDGLGAYGGSNLGVGLANAGTVADFNASVAADAGAGDALASARAGAINEATTSQLGKIGSGLSATAADPANLAKAMGGYGNLAGAALPVLGPMLADEATQTVTKMPSNGYIRNFENYDPLTQKFNALPPVKTSSLGYAPGGEIVGMDGGNGQNPVVKTVTQMPGVPDGSSKSAMDYLMGLTNTTHPPVTNTAPTIGGGGRFVWDPTTKSYKWVDAGAPAIAPIKAIGSTDPNANANQGAGGDSAVSDAPGNNGPADSVSNDGMGPAPADAPAAVGDAPAAVGDAPAAVGDAPAAPGDGNGDGAAGDGGAAAGGDGGTSAARGGFYHNGKFDQRPKGIARLANGGIGMYAQGGLGQLGGYSDGGQLLRGPGDGVSDSIPATIANKQPARLADGEFVVPARIVSELGNGSTEAGARKLYQMMDRIQAARSKTVGKGHVAKNSRADKYLPG